VAARSQGSGVLTILVVGVLILIGKCSGESPSDDSDSTTVSSAAMPDVRGLRASVAENKIDEWTDGDHGPDTWDIETRDYSAKDRYPDDNWRVVDTWPRSGRTVNEDASIRIYALRASEISWFRAHRRMPRIPAGVTATKMLATKGPFAGVRSLLLFRYAKGTAPRDEIRGETLTRDAEDGVGWDPRVEPVAERLPRDHLKEPLFPSDTLTVGRTFPRRGAAVRLGRVMTIVVRPKPPKPDPSAGGGSGGGGNYSGSFSYSDGDDDFNVPGWLCPTRFC